MLNPHTDRLDYGDKLKSPEGFTLSHAVATTYSLDLETLLCLPLALSLNCTPEGDLQSDKLALMEAIAQLQGKVKVFFQQGCIKLPRQFNWLFSLLEPLLVPQVPSEPFSSFHPKLWLLRFSNPENEVRYRLLVLSRNLTFDRSWDLAVTLEGKLGRSRTEYNDGLVALLKSLTPGSGDFRPMLETVIRELPRVAWVQPEGFNESKTLPAKLGARPLEFGATADTVLVMSPFLHGEALDLLKRAGARHWLFSRADEIERLGEKRLEGWECFALNHRLIDGEDELGQARPQNLHAKLVVLQNGSSSHWHIGSANATKAALGGLKASPRNTEFMLRLSSKPGRHSAHDLRSELVGSEEAPTGIFIPHRFGELTLPGDTSTEGEMRRLQHMLIQGHWLMRAVLQDNGSYTCSIECPLELFEQIDGWIVQVQPLVKGQAFVMAPRLVWKDYSLTQLSAFLVLRIISPSSEQVDLLIKAELLIEGGDTREQAITHALIDSPHKLLAYIHMLLQPWHAYPENTGRTGGRGSGADADGILGRMLGGPLHEALLRCAARQPEKLQRIDAILDKLRDTEHLIPPELSALWTQYQQLAWKKKA